MNGREFFVSAPGRLACATGFVALAGPGAMALSGPSPSDVAYAACILIVCILGLIATAVLSVERFTVMALAIAFFAPLIAGFYVAGLSVFSAAGTLAGWAAVTFALLPLATLIMAVYRSGETSEAQAVHSEGSRVHAA